MHPVLVLVRKDFINFLRNKAAVSLTFIVPFAMIALFGQIFGVNRKDSGPNGIPVAVVNASDNPAAAKLVEVLKAEKSFRILTQFVNSDGTKRPLTEADLRPLMQKPGADFRFALVLPADLVRASALGLHLKFFSNPRNEIETQTVNGLLQKAIFSNVPELLGQSLQARAKDFLGDARFDRFNDSMATAISSAFGGDHEKIRQRISSGDFGFGGLAQSAPPAGSVEAAKVTGADIFSKIVRIETEQVVGANVKSPMATSLVGGWAIQFLLFALSASATSLFRERDTGMLQIGRASCRERV